MIDSLSNCDSHPKCNEFLIESLNISAKPFRLVLCQKMRLSWPYTYMQKRPTLSRFYCKNYLKSAHKTRTEQNSHISAPTIRVSALDAERAEKMYANPVTIVKAGMTRNA